MTKMKEAVLHPDWDEIPTPRSMADLQSRTFVNKRRMLVATVDEEMGRLHMSVSQATRVPTWKELGDARDALIPEGVWMMVPHPPRSLWLNYNPRVLHMWEFDDPVLIEQFEYEGRLAQKEGFGSHDGGGP